MQGFLGLVGVFMIIGAVMMFGSGPNALSLNIVINLFGYGVMFLGLSAVVDELQRIRKYGITIKPTPPPRPPRRWFGLRREPVNVSPPRDPSEPRF